jgi:hypothetical protein
MPGILGGGGTKLLPAIGIFGGAKKFQKIKKSLFKFNLILPGGAGGGGAAIGIGGGGGAGADI